METQMKQLISEINAINQVFKSFGVKARTTPKLTKIGGKRVILYGVEIANGQSIESVFKRTKELNAAISGIRKTVTKVRINELPLWLEVEHPSKESLEFSCEVLKGNKNQILLGKAYSNGSKDLWLDIDSMPHCLVAAGSGGGKSVQMLAMILSAAFNNSLEDLVIELIDLKRTDFRILERLNHVNSLAMQPEEAANTIERMANLLDYRQDNLISTPTTLIVIDEFTDLINDEKTMGYIDRIARQGRSSGIHIIAATQHPTSKALGGPMIKNNFLVRCVGNVSDANASSNASGRPGIHAELLPDKGSFLYVKGNKLQRYETYFITDILAESSITKINRKYPKPLKPVLKKNHSPLVVEPVKTTSEPVLEPLKWFSEPLSEPRQLNEKEAARVRELYANGNSKNQLCKLVFGSKNGKTLAEINRALTAQQPATNKIIQMRIQA